MKVTFRFRKTWVWMAVSSFISCVTWTSHCSAEQSLRLNMRKVTWKSSSLPLLVPNRWSVRVNSHSRFSIWRWRVTWEKGRSISRKPRWIFSLQAKLAWMKGLKGGGAELSEQMETWQAFPDQCYVVTTQLLKKLKHLSSLCWPRMLRYVTLLKKSCQGMKKWFKVMP